MVTELEYVEVARAESERGELVLRERRPVDGGPTSLELRANGVFVMDTVEVSTERAMAHAALAVVDEPRAVVVGGLGLGYTMHEVLADSRVEKCAVVEIEPALVEWMRAGLVPDGPALLADERVTVVEADVARRARRGPRGVVRPGAARRRQRPGLPGARRQRRALRAAGPGRRPPGAAPGRRAGRLVGGRGARARGVADARSSAASTAERHDVRLQERDEHYWLYVARP